MMTSPPPPLDGAGAVGPEAGGVARAGFGAGLCAGAPVGLAGPPRGILRAGIATAGPEPLNEAFSALGAAGRATAVEGMERPMVRASAKAAAATARTSTS
jgi:hypothetical protein